MNLTANISINYHQKYYQQCCSRTTCSPITFEYSKSLFYSDCVTTPNFQILDTIFNIYNFKYLFIFSLLLEASPFCLLPLPNHLPVLNITAILRQCSISWRQQSVETVTPHFHTVNFCLQSCN